MTSSSTSSAAISQASRACAAQSLNQSQDRGISSLFIKARPTLKKPTMPGKPLGGPNPLIQAAAFAAGGRIANPSTAASLFKAAQSKNAVHIRPGGSSLPISSTIANKSSASTNSLGAQSTPQPHPGRPIPTLPPPASFGTTLSSQRSSQPVSLLVGSCSTTSDASSQQTSSESKPEAVQGPNSLENAERKSSIDSDTSDIDVEELLSEDAGAGARETRSADAVTKEGQTDHSTSPSSKNPTVVEKDQLQKETAPGLALAGDNSGTQIHDEELREKGSAGDGCAGSESVGDDQLGGVADSKSLVNGQSAD